MSGSATGTNGSVISLARSSSHQYSVSIKTELDIHPTLHATVLPTVLTASTKVTAVCIPPKDQRTVAEYCRSTYSGLNIYFAYVFTYFASLRVFCTYSSRVLPVLFTLTVFDLQRNFRSHCSSLKPG